VERGREVVVQQLRTGQRGEHRRPHPADQRHEDDPAEIEEDVAGQGEVAA
jgi:hypothetical protein